MSRNISNLFATASTSGLPTFMQLPLLLIGTSLLTACGSASENGVDPGIETFPIAYTKRVVSIDDNDNSIIQPDLRNPLFSEPGGDIFIKQNASVSSPAINITAAITNNLGDVKDLDVSSDGKLLVFALLEEDLAPDDNTDNPTWNIYIYNRETGGDPVRVIQSQELADRGDDIAPYFLPDNSKIVFSSNRQKRSRALVADEDLSISKAQFAYSDESNNSRIKAMVLHTMDLTDINGALRGTNIQQISFNQSHDLDPIVLNDGRILFSRWDNLNGNNAMSLYTILQDGSDLQPFYGPHDESHTIPGVDLDDNSIHFTQAKELPDGRIMLLQRSFTDTFGGGDIVIVDANNFVDKNQPTSANAGAMGTSASAVEPVVGTTPFDDSIAIAGRYASFYPLDDTGRLLVSKGSCQLEMDTTPDADTPTIETRACIEPFLSDPSAVETYPSYGIWLYDSAGQSEKPVELGIVGSGTYLGDAVVMRPYTRPNINVGHSEGELNPELITENVGLLNIRNIYDFGIVGSQFNGCFLSTNKNYCATVKDDPNTGNPRTINSVQQLADPSFVDADQRPAHFIRLVKAVGIPTRNNNDGLPRIRNSAFGRTRGLGMKEIIGYAPIRPDGSVLVKVPSDVAFYFEILDKQARRIGNRHENWLQIKAGDTLTCAGCHRHERSVDNNTPRPLPLPHGRINAAAAPMSGGAASGDYPNTQNPDTTLPYVAQAGETMAETLLRLENASNTLVSITPSVNVAFTDLWTNPDDNTLTPGEAATLTYTPPALATAGASGLTTTRPNTAECEIEWNAFCRTVINYIEHIQPIWEVERLDVNDIAPLLPTYACTRCHQRNDPVDQSLAMVPAGQLDLKSVGADNNQPDRIISYIELFFNSDQEEIVNGALSPITVPGPPDEDNNPTVVNARKARSMDSSGARTSYFIEKMTETELDAGRSLTTTIDHSAMLTPAELRLISEYLDIGGQYFNNPFDPLAPQN